MGTDVSLFPMHMYIAAHADSFAAKRMRKIGQRRAVDYTSTVVRYMQVWFAYNNHILRMYLFGISVVSVQCCFCMFF